MYRRNRARRKERTKGRKNERKEERNGGKKGWASSSSIRQSGFALKLFIMGGEHFTL